MDRRATARRAGALAALCLLAAACSSPVGAPSVGGHGATVLTPAEARSVVSTTMTTNNRANARLDAALLATYEAGSAFRLDDSLYRADELAKAATGYVPPSSPFTLRVSALAVERSDHLPASFVVDGAVRSLASHAPKGPSCGSLLDFERTSTGSSWQIVLEPTVDGSALPALELGRDGYAAAVSAAGRGAAATLPGEFVRALETEETSGRLGPFTRSDFTGSCWELPNPREDVTDAEAEGFSGRDLYSVATPHDTASWALRGGSTLVLFTVGFDDQLIAGNASRPISWSHASPKKDPGGTWTYFLAAGSYAEVRELGELEVAVVVGPTGDHYRVVGSYEAVTSVEGERVSPDSVPSGTLTAAVRRT